jgi:hypothetical protein
VCGACCFGQGERYVPISGDDHARLGVLAEQYTQFIGNRCYMRMRDGHCGALHIGADGRFVCEVYSARPTPCRELARGGGACRVELEQKRSLAAHAQLTLPRAPTQPALAARETRGGGRVG